MRCIIDAIHDEKYLTLCMWGKPVIFYSIDSALDSNAFDSIFVVADSKYIKYLISEFYGRRVEIVDKSPQEGVLIDGRATCILSNTIKKLVSDISVDGLVNIFDYITSEEERVIIDSSNNFELSLVISRKQNRNQWINEMILNRIEDKKSILSSPYSENDICFVGHSQFDQWDVKSICGKRVRNCGISGITTQKYINYLLDTGVLKFSEKIIIVLIGINDIILPQTIKTISDNIIELIIKIQKKSKGRVFFLQILHINGRLDRDNKQVDELNKEIKNNLPVDTIWVSTEAMDDEFGNLNYKFTNDGLHLNDIGYNKLEEIITKEIKYLL